MEEESQDYTIDEVAALLRVNRKTVEREIQRGNITATRAGERQKRISRKEFEDYKTRPRATRKKQGSKKEGDLALAS